MLERRIRFEQGVPGHGDELSVVGRVAEAGGALQLLVDGLLVGHRLQRHQEAADAIGHAHLVVRAQLVDHGLRRAQHDLVRARVFHGLHHQHHRHLGLVLSVGQVHPHRQRVFQGRALPAARAVRGRSSDRHQTVAEFFHRSGDGGQRTAREAVSGRVDDHDAVVATEGRGVGGRLGRQPALDLDAGRFQSRLDVDTFSGGPLQYEHGGPAQDTDGGRAHVVVGVGVGLDLELDADGMQANAEVGHLERLSGGAGRQGQGAAGDLLLVDEQRERARGFDRGAQAHIDVQRLPLSQLGRRLRGHHQGLRGRWRAHRQQVDPNALGAQRRHRGGGIPQVLEPVGQQDQLARIALGDQA